VSRSKLYGLLASARDSYTRTCFTVFAESNPIVKQRSWTGLFEWTKIHLCRKRHFEFYLNASDIHWQIGSSAQLRIISPKTIYGMSTRIKKNPQFPVINPRPPNGDQKSGIPRSWTLLKAEIRDYLALESILLQDKLFRGNISSRIPDGEEWMDLNELDSISGGMKTTQYTGTCSNVNCQFFSALLNKVKRIKSVLTNQIPQWVSTNETRLWHLDPPKLDFRDWHYFTGYVLLTSLNRWNSARRILRWRSDDLNWLPIIREDYRITWTSAIPHGNYQQQKLLP